jgi:hypothetical protein
MVYSALVIVKHLHVHNPRENLIFSHFFHRIRTEQEKKTIECRSADKNNKKGKINKKRILYALQEHLQTTAIFRIKMGIKEKSK